MLFTLCFETQNLHMISNKCMGMFTPKGNKLVENISTYLEKQNDNQTHILVDISL